MKNKIEGSANYDDMEEKDNVTDLLKLVKELSYATTSIQYSFYTCAEQYHCAGTIHQLTHEEITVFYKRWMSQIDVLESQYGPIVPLGLVDTNIDKDEAKKHFKACMFLLAVDRKRYGHVLEELNNQYLNGAKPYPTSVEGVVNMLAHQIDSRNHDDRSRGNNNNNNGPPPPDDNDGTKNAKSFHQTQEQDNDESDGVISH